MAEWNWRDHYEDRDKDGDEVVYVQENKLVYAYLDNGLVERSACIDKLIPKVNPKKLRPWTFEEIPVGTVVRHKESNGEQMIVGKEPKTLGNQILIRVAHHVIYTPVSIMERFTMLDGSPCGVEE